MKPEIIWNLSHKMIESQSSPLYYLIILFGLINQTMTVESASANLVAEHPYGDRTRNIAYRSKWTNIIIT